MLALEDTKGAKAPALVPVARDRGLPLSYAQERQWFLWQLDPDSAAYHVPSVLRLKGPLDQTALQHSFDRLVARHESLRTLVRQENHGTVQVVGEPAPVAITRSDVLEADLQATVEAKIARTFNLEHEPLLRVDLLRLAADDHVLVLSLIHI